MKIEEAIQIVLDLAVENMLTDKEVLADPEILGKFQKDQEEAINTVEAYFAKKLS